MLDRFGASAYARTTREAVVNDIGPALSPFNGFLLHQGMETLSLRMGRHVDSSLQIAAWLEQQPEVESVDYAGLPSNPLHGIAQRDYAGRTRVGVRRHGARRHRGARAFVNGLRVFSRMTGIGDAARSMVIHPSPRPTPRSRPRSTSGSASRPACCASPSASSRPTT